MTKFKLLDIFKDLLEVNFCEKGFTFEGRNRKLMYILQISLMNVKVQDIIIIIACFPPPKCLLGKINFSIVLSY